jgi:hypothetical protein
MDEKGENPQASREREREREYLVNWSKTEAYIHGDMYRYCFMWGTSAGFSRSASANPNPRRGTNHKPSVRDRDEALAR